MTDPIRDWDYLSVGSIVPAPADDGLGPNMCPLCGVSFHGRFSGRAPHRPGELRGRLRPERSQAVVANGCRAAQVIRRSSLALFGSLRQS
jgi:hypothetical protein